jgi:hypothetical protein
MDLKPRTLRDGGHQPGAIAHPLDLKLVVAALCNDERSWSGLVRVIGPGVNATVWTSDERFANEQRATNVAAARLTARLSALPG